MDLPIDGPEDLVDKSPGLGLFEPNRAVDCPSVGSAGLPAVLHGPGHTLEHHVPLAVVCC